MYDKIITGALYGAGALAFFGWGIYQAVLKTRDTPEQEFFDWLKAGFTIIPGVIGAFFAGYMATPSSLIDYALLVAGGFGIAAGLHEGDKALGVHTFFSSKK